jgi:hypothetical protein
LVIKRGLLVIKRGLLVIKRGLLVIKRGLLVIKRGLLVIKDSMIGQKRKRTLSIVILPKFKLLGVENAVPNLW